MDNIEKQLLEVESLKSMYFCENEFKVLNNDSLLMRELILKNEISFDLVDSIDIELNIVINDIPINVVIEIPADYPDVVFTSLTRCNHFNRHQHVQINSDSTEFISKLDKDDLSVISLLDWLRENFSKYFIPVEETVNKPKDKADDSYTRLWIYSHHLYSNAKKTSIKEWCKELCLDGFFLSGKPGIICVEGLTIDTNTFWWNIRHLNWKRIVLKEQECVSISTSVPDWKKFNEFREISFVNSPVNPDFSLFIKWLKDLQCDNIIPILFGIEVK